MIFPYSTLFISLSPLIEEGDHMDDIYTFPPWENVPAPYPYELLSSWLTRVSHSYYISPKELFSKHLSSHRLYLRDLDVLTLSPEALHLLSYLTQTSEKTITNMQLQTHVLGIIQKSIAQNSRNKWIIPSSGLTDLTKRRSSCLRICPTCMKEKPYFPISSKFLFITTCTKHQVYLIDRCPQCSAAILSIKTSPPKKIYDCNRCGFDLRKSRMISASEETVVTTKFLHYSIKHKYFFHYGDKYSILDYFDILYLIVRNLHRVFPHDELFLKYPARTMFLSAPSHYLQAQPPAYIAQLIAIAHDLIFEGWDTELLSFLKRYRLMYASQLLNKRENMNEQIPAWFFKHMETLWIKKSF